jgi:hypothetical protein
MINKYYVRVKQEDVRRFEEHTARNNLTFDLLSNDFGTTMYSMMMEDNDALSLKLSFPLVGCLNFNRVIAKQLDNNRKNK